MRLGSCYRVQVSRMMRTSLNVTLVTTGESLITQTHQVLRMPRLLVRNSKHRSIYAHFSFSGANWSLLPPRHRC
jgi:hypothetical protein